MSWNKISTTRSIFTSALRRKGLTPVRLLLIAGAMVLFAFPFIFPFTGAASSPLNGSTTSTPPPDGGTPVVAFASSSSSGAESTTPASLEVILSTPSGLTVTVNYQVSGGTATGGINTGSGIDFTLAAGKLTFAPGDTSESISVNILNDGLGEADETIVLNLSDPSNATLGEQTAHTYTILDDDGVPMVAFAAANSSAAESAPTVNLEVILSAPSELPVTVDFQVTDGTAIGSGFDYTLTDGTLTFAQGETSQTIAVTNVDDPLNESDETVVVTLSNPSNAVLGSLTFHTYTILDNDGLPTVSFALASFSATELVTQAIIAVNLSAPSELSAMVDFEVSGGTGTGEGIDYTLTAGTLTFAPGDITESITIIVRDDFLVEPDESVVVALLNPINATLGSLATHTYIIRDNDFPENGQDDDGTGSGSGGNHINIGDGNTIGVIIIGDDNTVKDVNTGNSNRGRDNTIGDGNKHKEIEIKKHLRAKEKQRERHLRAKEKQRERERERETPACQRKRETSACQETVQERRLERVQPSTLQESGAVRKLLRQDERLQESRHC